MSEWIDVRQRMPAEGVPVLCIASTGVQWILEVYQGFWRTRRGRCIVMHPIHWMPLPAPPEPKSKEPKCSI